MVAKKKTENGEEQKQQRRPLWVIYAVQMQFLGRLCGSVPGNPALIDDWINSIKPTVRPPGGRSIEEIQKEVLESLATSGAELSEEQIAEMKQKSLLIFQRARIEGSSIVGLHSPPTERPSGVIECGAATPHPYMDKIDEMDKGVLVVRSSTVRAHLKDCARILSAQYIGKISGERSFSYRLVNAVYPDEQQYWLPIKNAQGELVKTSDGIHEKPIHFRTRFGEFSALKAFEFVVTPRLDVRLKVLGDSVSQKDLERVFYYGGTHGYGGERGDGEGRYIFRLEKIGEEG